MQFDQTKDLLKTKLTPPGLGTSTIVRESLITALDEAQNYKFTLLSAPAGFGKTTLASMWLAESRAAPDRSPLPVAWVSLDEGDNDPVRFWRYIFTAIQAFAKETGRQVLSLLENSQQLDYEGILTTLINQLVSLPDHSYLVLDDYHAIINQHIHKAVSFLLEHLPPALHLIILTRSDPPLPLARMRARNEILEIRTSSLQFSVGEIQAFFQQVAIQAAPADMVDHLAERTEGWPAGLRLVALALQSKKSQEEQAHLLNTFNGSHNAILDYLLTDVLTAQPEPIQAFILQTSFLSRLTGDLCNAVTGREDSQQVLDQIEQAGLFLEALDEGRQWYRYHGLFAEAMEALARQRLGVEHLRSLMKKASRWFEDQAMQYEAIQIALAAQEYDRAATLIEQFTEPRLVGQEYHTLRRWMEQLPEAVLRDHPDACMIYAPAILFTSETGERLPVERLNQLLQAAEQAWTAEGNQAKLGAVYSVWALSAWRQGDVKQAYEMAQQALELLPETSSLENIIEWRGLSLVFTGWQAFQMGQVNIAWRSLNEARTLFEKVGNMYGALDATVGLGDVSAWRADPQQAEQLYQKALMDLDQAPISQQDRFTRKARALIGLANVALDRFNLDEAEKRVAEALALVQQPGSENLLFNVSFLLAQIEGYRGQVATARNRLSNLIARCKDQRTLSMLEAWQARIALIDGDIAAAQRWANSRIQAGASQPILQQEQENLILARLKIVQGDADAVRPILTGWLADAQQKGRARSMVEIQVQMVIVELALGNQSKAREAMIRALKAAQSDHFLRFFKEGGPALMEILKWLAQSKKDLATANAARAVLSAISASQDSLLRSTTRPQQSIDSILTDQEERVLRHLAAGLSNDEIAQELVISVNTVKTHIKSIYRKLNINSRREARKAAKAWLNIS